MRNITLSYSTTVTFCGEPPSIVNGVFNAPSQLYEDVASYTCNTGYESSTSTNVSCQADGTWTQEPNCASEEATI